MDTLRHRVPWFFNYCSGYIDTVTGTGSITLPKAKANGLKSVKLFGGCEQSGTPTPTTPQDIISNNGVLKYSANMANVNEQTVLLGYYISAQGVVTADVNNWIYQAFIPVKPNTTYTLSMSSSVYYVSISEYSTADNSGFIVRKAGSTGTNTQLTITTGASTNFMRFGTNIDRTVVTLEEVLAINWMLNVGNSMAYQPYVEGGIYTNGTVETVQLTGKNLFDVSANPIEQGNIASATGADANSSYRCRTNGYIPVRPNTTYTLTASIAGFTSTASGGVYVYQYNEDASVWDTSGWKTPNGYTFTTNATAVKLRIVFGISNTTTITPSAVSNVQLELGSSPTSYAPYYNGGTATAERLLKAGTYADIQEVLSGNVTRNVGIKVLDGTENWAKGTSGSNFAFYIDETGNAVGDSGLSCMSNIAVGVTNSWSVSGVTVRSNKNFGFVKPSNMTIASTVTDWTTYLSTQYANGTPVIVVYPLASSTAETVTPQTLQVQAGTNILQITQASIDNLPLEATYKRGK